MTGANLLRAFIGHRIQKLRRRAAMMWMYPRPDCSDRSFSTELDNTEIDT
jgi:hypothetical protein